ncbi:hypothetical protein P7C70_g7069, partial [Phenoliferia sp. Uapishka_3]
MIADQKPPPAIEERRVSGVEDATATESRPGIPRELEECGKELDKKIADYHAMVGDRFIRIEKSKVWAHQKLDDLEKIVACLTAALTEKTKDIDALHLEKKELEDRLQLVEATNATLKDDVKSLKGIISDHKLKFQQLNSEHELKLEGLSDALEESTTKADTYKSACDEAIARDAATMAELVLARDAREAEEPERKRMEGIIHRLQMRVDRDKLRMKSRKSPRKSSRKSVEPEYFPN